MECAAQGDWVTKAAVSDLRSFSARNLLSDHYLRSPQPAIASEWCRVTRLAAIVLPLQPSHWLRKRRLANPRVLNHAEEAMEVHTSWPEEVSVSTSSPGVLASARNFMHAGATGASTSEPPIASQRRPDTRESAPASIRGSSRVAALPSPIGEAFDDELDRQTSARDDRFAHHHFRIRGDHLFPVHHVFACRLSAPLG